MKLNVRNGGLTQSYPVLAGILHQGCKVLRQPCINILLGHAILRAAALLKDAASVAAAGWAGGLGSWRDVSVHTASTTLSQTHRHVEALA